MSYSLSSKSMREIDNYSINEVGISSAVLMERAALKVAGHICEDIPKGSTVCVIYGKGNNGGDGLAIGRILAMRGYRVFAAPAWSDEEALPNEMVRAQLKSAVKSSVRPLDYSSFCELFKEDESGFGKIDAIDAFVDAMFGIGLSRDIEGDYAKVVSLLNSCGKRIYSVDIPSGISADTGEVLKFAVRADVTVTFGFMKKGLLMYPGAEYAGKVYVEDAGFAIVSEGVEAFVRSLNDIPVSYYASKEEVQLPARIASGNKGSYGKLLIIGGGKGCAGAAYLAAHAAFMSGVGMVKVLTCEDTVKLLNEKQPEAMTGVLFDAHGELIQNVLGDGLKWASTVLVGPGLGTGEAAVRAFKTVLECGKPMVIDADALNILAGMVPDHRAEDIAALIAGPAILTPHIGELSRLTGRSGSYLKSHIFDTADEYTYNNTLTYVLKDARTLVAGCNKRHLNINGNSGMSTAGSGDVLAGITGAFLAAGLEHFEAAAAAVYVHAAAGDSAAEKLGQDSMTAGDIARNVPEVMKELRQ